jgi:hypothetical protein
VPGLVQGVKIHGNLFQAENACVYLGSTCKGIDISQNQFYGATIAAATAWVSVNASARNITGQGNYSTTVSGANTGLIFSAVPVGGGSLADKSDGNGLVFGPSGTNYVYLPGKKLMAWSTALSIGTGATAVTFGVTFAAAPVVTATPNGAPSAVAVGVSGITTTGFNAYVGSGSHSVNWIAIGTAP